MDFKAFFWGAVIGFILKVITDSYNEIKNSGKCPKCGGELFWNSYDQWQCVNRDCGYYKKG